MGIEKKQGAAVRTKANGSPRLEQQGLEELSDERLRIADLQDELAAHVAALALRVRLADLRKRQDRRNHRVEMASIDQRANLGQIFPVTRIPLTKLLRTPCSAAASGDGNWTREANIPPGLRTPQERVWVLSPISPTRSRTTSTS